MNPIDRTGGLAGLVGAPIDGPLGISVPMLGPRVGAKGVVIGVCVDGITVCARDGLPRFALIIGGEPAQVVRPEFACDGDM